MTNKTYREVAIVRNNVPIYRVPLYNKLKELLREHDVNLRVFYSHADELSLAEGFDQDLSWGELVDVRLLAGDMTWHPLLARLKHTDLVIVEDASRHLLNYALFLKRRFGGPRLALWGHGWNHTDPPSRLGEWLKDQIGKRSDWYFAYTASVKDGLIRRGYDATRISDVQNCLPPPDLAVSAAERERVRCELGLPPDSTVALFCGRMYASKRLGFLIAAAIRARERVPDFRLVLGGGGPDQCLAEEAARRHPFIHYSGPLQGTRKTAVYRLSKLVAMPGLVGLALVDAFQHDLPLVTTSYPYQAPEIDYLESGVNGLITEDNLEAFSHGLCRLATDEAFRARLVAGCRATARRVTFEEMLRRFAEGILKALDR